MSACRGQLVAISAAALVLVVAGCDPAARVVPATAEASIPAPDLAELDPMVSEQIRRGQEQLRNVLGRDATRAERAEEYGNLGKIYHAYEFIDSAEQCYELARQLDENAWQWSYYLGHIHRERSDGAGIETAFRRVLDLDPGNLAALLHLGEFHLAAEDVAAAAPLYERARAIDAECAAVLDGLGRIAAARGEPKEAVRCFLEALEVAPGAGAISYRLGMVYRDSGHMNKALEFLGRRGDGSATIPDPLMDAVKALATGVRILNNNGTSLFLAGRYADAEREFRRAVSLDAESALSRTNLGAALTLLGREDDARVHFAKALELDPDNLTANFNMGTLTAKQGDDPGAISYYEKTLALEPGHKNAHFNYANALRRLGRFEEAVGHYRATVTVEPRNAPARLGECLTLVRLRSYREALASIEASHRALPEHIAIRDTLARLLATVPEEALRNGSRAVALAVGIYDEERKTSGPNARHVETMAMALAEAGDFDKAQEWQKALIGKVRQDSSRQRWLRTLVENLDGYAKKQPCRVPWKDDDVVLSPGRERRRD